MNVLLAVKNVVAGYGRGPDILRGIDVTVRQGQILCVIGPNGAGKSTLLKAISGLLPPRSGEITYQSERIDGLRPDQILQRGICFVPQERALFPDMTVRENLRMGGFSLQDKSVLDGRIDEVFEMFPILRERSRQLAKTMSGGQQQILAMARTLVLKPKIVMLDEPSLGLAPIIVQQIFDMLQLFREKGMTIVLIEQNALAGLAHSDWGLVLDLGRALFDGPAASILADPRIQELYLGKRNTAVSQGVTA